MKRQDKCKILFVRICVAAACMPLYNVKKLLNMCKKHNEYTDFHLFLIEKRNCSIIGKWLIMQK
jgi:hypothetical protein